MRHTLITIAFALSLGSCATPTPEPAPPTKSCVFQSEKEAKVFAEFQGREVGFCCEKCAAQWETLTDMKKDALMAVSPYAKPRQ